MRNLLFICSAFLLLSSACSDISLNSLSLDNQSDYNVTVTLETGNTNPDGSIAFDTYSVSANSKTSVELNDNSIVYVKGYTPSEFVDMDFQETKSKILFTNK